MPGEQRGILELQSVGRLSYRSDEFALLVWVYKVSKTIQKGLSA